MVAWVSSSLEVPMVEILGGSLGVYFLGCEARAMEHWGGGFWSAPKWASSSSCSYGPLHPPAAWNSTLVWAGLARFSLWMRKWEGMAMFPRPAGRPVSQMSRTWEVQKISAENREDQVPLTTEWEECLTTRARATRNDSRTFSSVS